MNKVPTTVEHLVPKQQLAITKFSKNIKSCVNALNLDLAMISSSIKDNKLADLEFPSPGNLIKHLNAIVDYANPQKSLDILRLARIYVRLMEDYEIDCYPDITAAEGVSLRSGLKSISNQIGVIASLINIPTLPEDVFLPKNFLKTKKKWQETPCLDPKRGNSAGEIRFIKDVQGVSIRRELKAREKEQAIKYITLGSGDCLFLNLLDFNYYTLGLMHADHLQSSVSLIARLKEVIECMNYNPKFKTKLLTTYRDRGYFIKQVDGSIVGSYWLYMLYHNCVENLWFLLASDNSGEGKMATDPIEWLKSFELGREYLKINEKNIDTSDILYTMSDHKSLKDSFSSFVLTQKRDPIKTCRSIAEMSQHFMGQAKAITDKKELQYTRFSAHQLRSGGLFGHKVHRGSSNTPSLPSLPDTENSQDFYDDMDKRLAQNPKHKSAEKLQREALAEAAEDATRDRKKRKRDKVDNGTSSSRPAKKSK